MFSASASKQSHLFHNLDKGSMQLQNWMNLCSFTVKLQIFLQIVNMILTQGVAMKIKKNTKKVLNFVGTLQYVSAKREEISWPFAVVC